MDAGLLARVRRWMEEDPDPQARTELQGLIDAGDEAELGDRFAGELEFGTAGLRGLLGAGPRRMNRAVVARATAGLCAELVARVPDARERGLCIGFDARHGSRAFAEEVAAVAAGAGFTVRPFRDVVPTPLLAFAVRDAGAAGGVMVTASHNPPAYNGYKVYWEDGAQIVPPLDAAIAARIRGAGPAAALPRLDPEGRRAAGLERGLGDDVTDRYLEAVRTLVPHAGAARAIRIAHTALHGVGAPLVRAALAEAGFGDVVEVREQAAPHPDFPTVAFPNPEEPGAMDRVLSLARQVDAQLVLANDPDADRLAVAVRDDRGEHVVLNGNQIGCLIGHYLLQEGAREARPLVISTVVSSPLLGRIAEAHGARFEQTLTGFKWIAHRALELERDEGLRFVFGYEEALGYCPGRVVRDKDGISAAVVVADMVDWYRSRGRTLLDVLQELAERHGLFASRQVSVMREERGGHERIAEMMDALRHAPPDRLGGLDVVAVQDVLRSVRREPGGETAPLALPPSDLLVLELAGGHRAMVRPSGTEPKLKYYVDVRVPLQPGEAAAAASARGEALLDAIVGDLRAHVEG
ncbi:MAG: phospho-sugar mutase [Myxococcota bacterium]